MKNYLNDIQPKMVPDSYTQPKQVAMNDNLIPTTPRSMYQDPNIKDTGAPVAFSPKSIPTINGVFGTAIDQSFDRAINTTQGQAM
jgi:hypothetical protein